MADDILARAPRVLSGRYLDGRLRQSRISRCAAPAGCGDSHWSTPPRSPHPRTSAVNLATSRSTRSAPVGSSRPPTWCPALRTAPAGRRRDRRPYGPHPRRHVLRDQQLAADRRDRRAELDTIDVPTVILVGSADTIIPHPNSAPNSPLGSRAPNSCPSTVRATSRRSKIPPRSPPRSRRGSTGPNPVRLHGDRHAVVDHTTLGQRILFGSGQAADNVRLAAEGFRPGRRGSC